MTQLLLAQTHQIWLNVIQALSNNGFWVFAGFCVLAGTAKHLVGVILKHEERMAMIKAGMQPGQDTSLDS